MAKTLEEYPICPECGQHTIVLFTPPRLGVDGRVAEPLKLGTNEYINWDLAHLYCCNATTNCKFNTKLNNLTTPIPQTGRPLSALIVSQIGESQELDQLRQNDPAKYARLCQRVLRFEDYRPGGYHSLEELFKYGDMTFMAVCSLVYLNSYQRAKMDSREIKNPVWMHRWADDYFTLGIYMEEEKQVWAYIPIEHWQTCLLFAEELSERPSVYIASPTQKLERLKALL